MGTTVVLDAARHAEGPPRRLRSQLVGLRRHADAAEGRDDAAGAALALRGLEAHLRAAPDASSRSSTASRREPSLLQRLRSAPGSDEPVRRGHPELHHRGAEAHAPDRLRRRRADARLLLHREHRRGEPPRSASTSNKLAGEVVNIACGERISLNQLLSHISEESGFKLEPQYAPGRAGDVRDSLASIDAARELLGYEPKVKVREGLHRTFAAFKAMYA